MRYYGAAVDDEHPSLEHLQTSDAYPKPMQLKRVLTNGDLIVVEVRQKATPPSASSGVGTHFPFLPGESILFHSDFTDVQIITTEFRVLILFGPAGRLGFYNIPVKTIDSLECRELFFLLILCKDGRAYRIAFDNNECCLAWYRCLLTMVCVQPKLENSFAFPFFAWCTDEGAEGRIGLQTSYDDALVKCDRKLYVEAEFARLNFDANLWRIVDKNKDYKFCATYPSHWISPRYGKEKDKAVELSDDELEQAAAYRSLRRLPAIVWKHMETNATLMRSSQPLPSLLGWRSVEDEKLLKAVLHTHSEELRRRPAKTDKSEQSRDDNNNKTMLILDARSYAAALANRAKGGGYESENYENCEVQFMGLPNIHAIRKSFQQLRTLLATPVSENKGFLSSLENTGWLQNLTALFNATEQAMRAVAIEGRPVLVHCSDGWDRTTQIVSLAKLLLDPYYRTMQGFRLLIEREWVEFGHKFSDRCGMYSEDTNERSPVFLQWLDCVHQLQQQFSCSFEFNACFLIKLAQHSYSGLFGDFLTNSFAERMEKNIDKRTFSIWSLLHPTNYEFRNALYCPCESSGNDSILWPVDLRDLKVWFDVYCPLRGPGSKIQADIRAHQALQQSPGDGRQRQNSTATPLNKSRSYDDLVAAALAEDSHEHEYKAKNESSNSLQRVGSDPSLPPSLETDVDCAEAQSALEFLLDSVSLGKSKECQEACPGLHLVPASASCVGEAADKFSSSSKTNGTCSASKFQLMVNGEYDCVVSPDSNDICDMSTSTSDISDSFVKSHFLNGTLTARPLKGRHVQQQSEAAMLKRLPNMRDVPIPLAESTPQSSLEDVYAQLESCSLEQKKFKGHGTMTSWHGGRGQKWLLSNWLDSDGLTRVYDPVQTRVKQLETQYKMLLLSQNAEIKRIRGLLSKQLVSPSSTQSERRRMDSLTEVLRGEEPNGEPRSYDSGSGGYSSDYSWEAVDEKDGLPTLWIPDHAVTKCMGCDIEFGVVRRKHHCRNCGKIFCATCSNFESPVPSEQLYESVRVCGSCYSVLRFQDVRNVTSLPQQRVQA